MYDGLNIQSSKCVILQHKGIKDHKYIYINFYRNYLSYLHKYRYIFVFVLGSKAGNDGGLWQYKEKMNSMENRKIKHFIVWVRHAFIILIGSVLCVCVCVCDWCGVLCCMSRWVIGLLIFPLAEHKSLFYPPSLNLSRVKCLCSQLLTELYVCGCLLPFANSVCVFSRMLLQEKKNGRKLNDSDKLWHASLSCRTELRSL